MWCRFILLFSGGCEIVAPPYFVQVNFDTNRKRPKKTEKASRSKFGGANVGQILLRTPENPNKQRGNGRKYTIINSNIRFIRYEKVHYL